MNIESLRNLCHSFEGVTEDVKWGGQELCFSVGPNMFCVTDAGVDAGASFKVSEEGEFDELVSRAGIIPAPYLARQNWITVLDFARINDAEWAFYIRQSYELVKGSLPQEMQKIL